MKIRWETSDRGYEEIVKAMMDESSDNVEFTFSDENSGVLIRGEGFSAMYVVMPVII